MQMGKYNTFSHGSEGLCYQKTIIPLGKYNTFSHGSEG